MSVIIGCALVVCLLNITIICPLIICVCAYKLKRRATVDAQHSTGYLPRVLVASIAVEVLSVGGIVVLLAPGFMEAQQKTKRDACKERLMLLDKSIQLAQANGVVVTNIAQLIPTFWCGPWCPSDTRYYLTNLHGNVRGYCPNDESHTYR